MYSQKKQKEVYSKEIWECCLDGNVGTEIRGKGLKFLRPVLIIKSFSNGSAIGMPLTSKQKSGTYYYKINDSYVVLTQIKYLDNSRFYRKVGGVSKTKFSLIIFKLITLLIK